MSCVGSASKLKPITSLFSNSSTNSISTVPASEKYALTDTLACMCATDICPFTVVEGKGLLKASQHLIAIGHKYGNVSAEVVLPSARSISRHVETSAEAKRQDLIVKIALEDHSMFEITTDLWTHDSNKLVC
jgi:hypothetical protein